MSSQQLKKDYIVSFISDYNFTEKDLKTIMLNIVKDYGDLLDIKIISKLSLAYIINNSQKATFSNAYINVSPKDINLVADALKKHNKIIRFLITTTDSYYMNNQILNLDNLTILKKYLTDACRILSRKYTLLNKKDQNKLATSIKRARFLGLIPYFFRG